MPRFFDEFLPLRIASAAAAVFMLLPGLPAFAQSQQAGVLQVDIPAPNTLVSNGQSVDIGGWTAGTRVDVYLDGPAGFGEGIGSTDVDSPRPDVAQITGNSKLAASGFDLGWSPTDLTAGPHTLYVYSLVDSSWSMQTRPIVGEGNLIDLNPGQNDDAPVDIGVTDNVTDNGAAVNNGAAVTQ